MLKEIPYQGLSAVPSDYQSPDGTLSSALNLIPEDGQLNPVLQPATLVTLPSGYIVVFLHKTADYTHYIVQNNNAIPPSQGLQERHPKLYYATALDNLASVSTMQAIPLSEDDITITSVSAIGNTLIVNSSIGLHYLLWKKNPTEASATYHYLGQHIPELPLSFSLNGEPKFSTHKIVTIDEVENPSTISEAHRLPSSWAIPPVGSTRLFINADGSDYTKNALTEAALAQVNTFINDESIHNGKFLFPFFVRYAFRLFDGSLTMHSSPVLMVTNSGTCPQTFICNWMRNTRYPDDEETSVEVIGGYDIRTGALLFDLEYNPLVNLDDIQLWSDIVKSIDIFVSAPIYTYNASGEVEGFSCLEETEKGFSVSSLGENSFYGKHYATSIIIGENDYGNNSNSHVGCYGLDELILPHYSDDKVNESLRNCCNFYLLKSIPIDELATSRTKIPVPEDYLSSLTSREAMTDDYNSHNFLFPSITHVYNSRLHLCNMRQRLASPLPPAAYTSFTNGLTATYKVFVFINRDGKTSIVDSSASSTLGITFPFSYFYYPDPNAYSAVVLRTGTHMIGRNGDLYTLPLRPHEFLNGAVFSNGFDPTVESNSVGDSNIVPIPSSLDELTFHLPNKLYVSEVGNPFYFPVTSICTIGAGSIIGIASASKALSQGQFGQFPLYAFTSDGVWALSVNSTGTYSAIQPVTRDVCSNPDSITSTDSEVLFATNRGIMLLSGSNSTCITDTILSQHPFDPIASLPHSDQLHTLLGHDNCNCLSTQPFLSFLANCRLLYDYLHQRVVLFNPSLRYAYLYSLKSKLWGSCFSTLTSPVNSYPNALAMNSANQLVSLSSSSETSATCFLLTRPLKLGAPDTLKAIHSIIQRGVFHNEDLTTILYGSRDMLHWHLIGSSRTHRLRYLRGSGYKYFRIAATASLSPDCSIAGASIQFEPQLNNQLR